MPGHSQGEDDTRMKRGRSPLVDGFASTNLFDCSSSAGK